MAHKGGYIFTNKEHPFRAVVSTVLGLISLSSVVMVLWFVFRDGGIAQPRYGMTMLLAVLFSLIGLVLGILSRMEPDKYYLFSYLGLVINALGLAGAGCILFAGVYGI